ncbi:MAG: hypothetical protein ACHRXM_28425, partial [Isosphaerales bacterium]
MAQEINATRSRDPVLRAQSRARVATCDRLLSAALRSDGTSPLAALDTSQLDHLRDGYTDWKTHLARELINRQDAELLIETKQTDQFLRTIGAEYTRRSKSSSPTGKAQIARALKLLGESPEFAALRSSEKAIYQTELLQSLRLELDLPRT